MADIELDVVVVHDEGTTTEQPALATDKESFKSRLYSFLWERKKAIVFRLLAMVAIGFDIYSVWKKYSRGDYRWVIIAVTFLLMNPLLGSIYSLCCEVLEKGSCESPSSSKKEKKSRDEIKDYSKLAASDSVQGFNDVVMSLDYESDSSTEGTIPEETKPRSKAKKKKVALRFDDTPPNKAPSKQRKIKKGTYVEPGIMDPKMEGEEDYSEPVSKASNVRLSPKKFLLGVKEHCSLGMVLSHIFLFPKEYQFYYVSKILWRYYKEPFNKAATSHIKKASVKEVSFKPLWNEYIYREIISKQLSLLMAVAQTIPVTFIELLYWSMESQTIAKYNTDSETSFFNVKSFDGEQFNIFELASLMINMINISYRVVSLMNQTRKLNFSKEDLGLFHKIYLTIIYFFLLTSRIISLYFVMCLNQNGIVFTISILCVQFSITYLVTKDLYAEGNQVTMVMSNLLMLFLYVPPKFGRRITMFSYHVIILVEMIAMLVFGCYQLPTSTDLNPSPTISVVGQDVPLYTFYWFYASSLVLFIVVWFLNSERVSKCLFKYRERMDRGQIREVLREANSTFGTDYQIIIGYFGQDKSSFSAQQTIHLF